MANVNTTAAQAVRRAKTVISQAKRAGGALATQLAKEQVAYDIAGYRDAPPGLRIWGGATVDVADTKALLPWLSWAFGEVASRLDAEAS